MILNLLWELINTSSRSKLENHVHNHCNRYPKMCLVKFSIHSLFWSFKAISWIRNSILALLIRICYPCKANGNIILKSETQKKHFPKFLSYKMFFEKDQGFCTNVNVENLNTVNLPSLCHNIWAYWPWESLKLKKNKLCLTLSLSSI